MTSKNQAERADSLAIMQREKERERRRLRDRQRRQNMSQEQRERHLARRRRNYQLRRMRAQNAKALDSQQTNSDTRIVGVEQKLINPQSSGFSIELSHQGAQNSRKLPRRLRLSDIRHLARRLHCDGQQQIDSAKEYVSTKRLSLIHVKRLARALKVTER